MPFAIVAARLVARMVVWSQIVILVSFGEGRPVRPINAEPA
jgi:hypothetical protein